MAVEIDKLDLDITIKQKKDSANRVRDLANAISRLNTVINKIDDNKMYSTFYTISKGVEFLTSKIRQANKALTSLVRNNVQNSDIQLKNIGTIEVENPNKNKSQSGKVGKVQGKSTQLDTTDTTNKTNSTAKNFSEITNKTQLWEEQLKLVEKNLKNANLTQEQYLSLQSKKITLTERIAKEEERIEREFNIDLIATSPSVIYEVTLTNGQVISVDSPVKLPDRTLIKDIKEPYIRTNIFVPSDYIGDIMKLCQDKRGTYISMEYIDKTRVNIHYEIPLSEIVYDFFDKLKSMTKGYASFDYDLIGYKTSDLVKMDILLNGEIIDALSVIVHKDFAYKRGKSVVENLRKMIPRQQFEVPIQASIGSKIIARENIKAVRKNVLAKCYGGDVSRKRKLLEKQKEGKKRMKMVGSVEIPQEAFLSVLSMDED